MITKAEMVWRHLLVNALERDNRRSSITTLSHELDLAPTTVHKALERPREMGIVRGGADGLRLVDPRRLLLLWAGNRDLAKDLVYSTRVGASIGEIESELRRLGATLTAYSGYVAHVGRNRVADYDEVVAYGDARQLKRRFPSRPGAPNLLLLHPDPQLAQFGAAAPLCQIYVDLFNLPTWQAQRFLRALDRDLLSDVA